MQDPDSRLSPGFVDSYRFVFVDANCIIFLHLLQPIKSRGMSDNQHSREREEVFSKSVRAGKRTYFFDVKTTKSNDYFLTITESKKRLGDDGSPFYEKHKIFLYREDFEKFLDGFNEAVGHVNGLKPEAPVNHARTEAPPTASAFTDVDFDQLGKDS